MYWKYLKYVCKHKWFVFLECCKHGIAWKGITHDLSKFRPGEFIPYARYFYGDNQKPLYKEYIKRRFDKAWLLHIHRNPHHWQHWLLYKGDDSLEILPMPMNYLKEMVCDWKGAGKAITGQDNIVQWYSENKDKIKLRGIQKNWVEKVVK